MNFNFQMNYILRFIII